MPENVRKKRKKVSGKSKNNNNKRHAASKDNVEDRGYILLPDDIDQLLNFFMEFMQVISGNVEYYVTTEDGKKKRNFNGRKYIRTFAAYMVYYRFLAPYDGDVGVDNKIKKITAKPDGITGRESLCTVSGLQHPGRVPVILEFILALDSKFPFLVEFAGGTKETPENFYNVERFGTTCQTLRTKFKNNPIWFSDGYTFKTSEQKGLPSSWKCYLKALGFPLGRGAYDMKDDEEHCALVNKRK